ncbi:MAG: PAS domain-containing protein [Candidatus Marinimicrobia bacterium]|nr:PAS domain-containing protein [Candidatus Neomarinimicrobiota bacterium]
MKKILAIDRKQTEEVLRIERDNLNSIFEAMEDGVYIINQQYDIQYVNQMLEKDFGNYKGRKCYEYFTDRTEVCPQCKSSEVFAGKTIHGKWDSFKSQKTYDLIDTPLKNPDGSIFKLGIFRDITERKQVEEDLKKNEQFLNSILESVQDGVSVLNPDLTIRHVNGIMNKWYKKNLPLEGKKCYEAYHNVDKPCDPCPTLRCLKSGKTEWNVVPGLQGSPVKWIELFSYPIKNPHSDKVTGVVEFVRNITKRKEAEEKLKKRMTELEIFYEATVNREIMVNELRKEINDLLEKMGKKEKYKIVR